MSADVFTTDDASGFELDPRPARVVVFGSHLAFGSVGLNAGLPVYDEARIRCAAIPTIVLSNLPHYRSVHAIDVSAEWITGSLRDLEAAGALRSVDAVAVGYLATPRQADAIADWYRSLDATVRPPMILDPTFGDADVGFYTDPAVAPAVESALVPLASIVTPNLFELAHLTAAGEPVASVDATDLDAVVRRARALASTDGRTVVATGIRTRPGEIGNAIVTADDHRILVGGELSTTVKGLGDTFTAALVSSLVRGDDLPAAVDAAAARVRRAIEASRGAETPPEPHQPCLNRTSPA